MTIEQLAKVCHEANKAFCESLGDSSQSSWENAPEWQRSSAINGVEFHLKYPKAGPAGSHENWLAEKNINGWGWGPVKDVDKKQHPCFVSYEELPIEQKAKDILFVNIVHALKHLL